MNFGVAAFFPLLLLTLAFPVLSNTPETWSSYLYNAQHTGFNPSSGYVRAPAVPSWLLETTVPVASSPVLIDSPDPTVIIGVGSNLTAIDISTATILWTFSTSGTIESSPAVQDSIVLFGDDNKSLYALNANTGNPKWSIQLPASLRSSPVISQQGVVFIGCDDGTVRSYMLENGMPTWNITLGAPLYSSPALSEDEQLVFIGCGKHTCLQMKSSTCPLASSEDAYLYALYAANGSEAWRSATGGKIESSPSVLGGYVFIGSSDNHLYAFRVTDGNQMWAADLGSDVLASAALSPSGILYIVSYDGVISARKQNDGSQVWAKALGGPSSASISVGKDDTLYLGTDDNYLYALNGTDGKIIWRVDGKGRVKSCAALASDGSVIVGHEGPRTDPFASGGVFMVKGALSPATSPTPHPSPSPTPPSGSNTAGIVVGSVSGVLAVAGAAVAIWWLRRRKLRNHDAERIPLTR